MSSVDNGFECCLEDGLEWYEEFDRDIYEEFLNREYERFSTVTCKKAELGIAIRMEVADYLKDLKEAENPGEEIEEIKKELRPSSDSVVSRLKYRLMGDAFVESTVERKYLEAVEAAVTTVARPSNLPEEVSERVEAFRGME
ncbi:MAG: hypothetical protein ABEJ93_00415 [Candidatus Nanohalobium sp.]